MVSGCSRSNDNIKPDITPTSSTQPMVTVPEVTKALVDALQPSLVPSPEEKPTPTEKIINTGLEISNNDITRIDDLIETFVTGLVVEEFEGAYETFSAMMIYEDCSQVFGIGYSDFSSCLETEDGERCYFPSGFVALPGDRRLEENDLELALEIYDLDYESDKYGFLYTSVPQEFKRHCIFSGKYIVYGIDSLGNIVFDAQDYVKDCYDKELGNLYNYDSDIYVYRPFNDGSTNITGVPFFESIDYDAVKAEMERILKEQDLNFEKIEHELYEYYSPEILNAHLLQYYANETFLGYDVKELTQIISTLNPRECLRITPQGLVSFEVSPRDLTTAEKTAKWIVGLSAGLIVLTGTIVGFVMPPAKPMLGLVSGAAFDVLMQLMEGNSKVSDINWGKVAISAASGAVMAFVCPIGMKKIAALAKAAELGGFLTTLSTMGYTVLSSAVVGGATSVALTVVDGNDNYIEAFATGAAIAAAFTVASIGIGAVKNVVKNSKVGNWFRNITNKVKDKFKLPNGRIVENIDDADDVLDNVIRYDGEASAQKDIRKQLVDSSDIVEVGGYDQVSKYSVKNEFEAHEIPSFSAAKDSMGITDRSQSKLPCIRMSAEDHIHTASYGNSKQARQYRAAQKALCDQGKFMEALKMDFDDLRRPIFGDKYENKIQEALKYAKSLGW